MARRLLALAALTLFAAGCGSAAVVAPAKTSTPTLRRVGSLPQPISKSAAVELGRGHLLIIGGLVGNTSISTIWEVGALLSVVGHLPQPTHDAAAVLVSHNVYLFGGGSSASTPNVVRITPQGKATNTTPLGEPLSDLGAVVIGGKAYIVGGYTGTQFATAIIEYPSLRVVARLPQGTRYAGVAAIGRTIYVAGGLTTAGPTANIYAVTLGGKPRLIGKLPAPEDHAALAALSGTLYYVGGRKILAINPKTGRVTMAIHLPKSLSDATATSDGTQITIVGGRTKGIWLFTP